MATSRNRRTEETTPTASTVEESTTLTDSESSPVTETISPAAPVVDADPWAAMTVTAAPADTFAPPPVEVPPAFKNLISRSLIEGGLNINLGAAGTTDIEKEAAAKKVAAATRLLRAAAVGMKDAEGSDLSVTVKPFTDNSGLSFKVGKKRGARAQSETSATTETPAE